jgi:hypothetical protein
MIGTARGRAQARTRLRARRERHGRLLRGRLGRVGSSRDRSFDSAAGGADPPRDGWRGTAPARPRARARKTRGRARRTSASGKISAATVEGQLSQRRPTTVSCRTTSTRHAQARRCYCYSGASERTAVVLRRARSSSAARARPATERASARAGKAGAAALRFRAEPVRTTASTATERNEGVPRASGGRIGSKRYDRNDRRAVAGRGRYDVIGATRNVQRRWAGAPLALRKCAATSRVAASAPSG